YYETLEATQKGDLEITARLAWFLGILDAAIATAETTLTAVLRKERFAGRDGGGAAPGQAVRVPSIA
ncbi:hypothetical protein MKL09_11170, partial [Methylobacterium sp. J-048]|nr:hypothetical protein [Methylobacterium sp. J-048]